MSVVRKIRVLIIDDSATVRQTLASILASDPQIEVLGVASDPFVAAKRIAEEIPDVITLDVEMPRNGRHYLPAQADEPSIRFRW
jgi:two-component system chemotaxis response regulator CheB